MPLKFWISPEDLRSGKVTDIYFQRSAEILRSANIHKTVVMEVRATHLPDDYPWGIFLGVDEVLEVFRDHPVDIDGLPEASVFRAGYPVIRISGDYVDLAIWETALLGILCQQSGVATKAARCKKAAGDRPVLSFGARRMHPALSAIIDRAAYIGGCDGVSVVLSAEKLGIAPSGTMPHALVLIVGDTVEALNLFDRLIDPSVPRVALIDTFQDEKFETLRCADALKERLFAVRFDTPSSRRGNMVQLLEEVRWELDLRGYRSVRLFVSGGLDEHEILKLNPVADAYGVGTAISNAPTINFALDIVEIDGKPMAKRGKMAGAKDIWTCDDCTHGVITPAGQLPQTSCPHCQSSRLSKATVPLMRQGVPTVEFLSPQQLRQKVVGLLGKLEPIE